jgi:lysozyme
MIRGFGSLTKRAGMNDENPTTEPMDVPQEATKSNEDVAKEVLAGKWGRGQDRKQRLKEAGYDPVAVKTEVDKLTGRA